MVHGADSEMWPGASATALLATCSKPNFFVFSHFLIENTDPQVRWYLFEHNIVPDLMHKVILLWLVWNRSWTACLLGYLGINEAGS